MYTHLSATLQNRFDTILVTVCAYCLRRLIVLLSLFEDIRKKPFPEVLKLVALFLSFPCFHASQFFF